MNIFATLPSSYTTLIDAASDTPTESETKSRNLV